MRLPNLILPVLFLVLSSKARSQSQQKCCDNSQCSQKATVYAVKITGLVNYLGNFNEVNAAANEAKLNELKANYPQVYRDFIQTANEIAEQFFDKPRYAGSLLCFTDALPTVNKSNVVAWINYFRDAIDKPKFPSTEFCGGLSKRFEIAQGAAAFLSKPKMSYLGSARAYLAYTFRKKDSCGGNFRVMLGPGYFLHNRNSYITLNSRIGVRLADLKANVFSLGNLNLFGGYNTNFDHFSYAEGGLEVELGPFGVNVSANYNTDNSKFGFLVGLVIGNKKF
jgi:hypothetical protein